jgi:hypothetical protein
MWALGQGKTKENFTYSVHTVQPCWRGRFKNPWARRLASEPNQISLLIMDSNSDESLCDVVTTEVQGILWRSFSGTTSKTAGEYRVCSNTQAHLRLYSASTSEEDYDVGQVHRHSSHQTHRGHCSLALRRVLYTHLQGAQEERMTLKHHTYQWWHFHVLFRREFHTASGG